MFIQSQFHAVTISYATRYGVPYYANGLSRVLFWFFNGHKKILHIEYNTVKHVWLSVNVIDFLCMFVFPLKNDPDNILYIINDCIHAIMAVLILIHLMFLMFFLRVKFKYFLYLMYSLIGFVISFFMGCFIKFVFIENISMKEIPFKVTTLDSNSLLITDILMCLFENMVYFIPFYSIFVLNGT